MAKLLQLYSIFGIWIAINVEAVSINVIDVIDVQGYREIVVVNDQSKSTE
jgi:hypothetical protein